MHSTLGTLDNSFFLESTTYFVEKYDRYVILIGEQIIMEY